MSEIQKVNGMTMIQSMTKSSDVSKYSVCGKSDTLHNSVTVNGETASTKTETTEDGATLTLSEESQEAYEKQSYQEQMEDAKESGKAFEDTAKLMEIARRISNGDKVPYKDEKKLLEFSSKLYQTAKAAAMMHANQKHKKYDSMFDEDEESSKDEKLRELDRESSGQSASGTTAETGTDTASTPVESSDVSIDTVV